jgi:formate dehydrogenase subunit delta
MDPARLVYMANQIAAFFKAYPEDEAIAATEDHFLQFWDPRMRAGLIAALEPEGEKKEGSGLSPIALAAALRLRDRASSPQVSA